MISMAAVEDREVFGAELARLTLRGESEANPPATNVSLACWGPVFRYVGVRTRPPTRVTGLRATDTIGTVAFRSSLESSRGTRSVTRRAGSRPSTRWT
jgi:hypothetical protein